jgi:cobalt-zinc-cadmium efflux system outer membrane protein
MRLAGIACCGLLATNVASGQPSLIPGTGVPRSAPPAVSTETVIPQELTPLPTATLTQPNSESLTDDLERELPNASLYDVESLALANHPSIQSAIAAISAAQGNALQVGLYPNPNFIGGATQWGGSDTFWLGSFSQEFVVANKLRLQRSAALQEVRQAEYNLTQTRFEVLTTVRAVFYRTLALQRRVDALTELVEIAKKSFESGERLKRGGEGTLTDELQLKIQYRRAAAVLKSNEQQLAASKNSLAAVTGLPELKIGKIQGALESPIPEMDYTLVRAGVLAQNAQIGKAQAEIIKRRFLLRRAIVEPWPNVTIQSGYQYYTSFPHNQPMLLASLPIPVWNRNQGGIRQARANVSGAAASLRVTETSLSNLTADALGRLHSSTELVKEFEKEIVPAATQTVQLAQAAYQGGQFSLLQLLQAQRDLVDANLGYIDAQQGRWEAVVDIAQLLQLDNFPPTAPNGAESVEMVPNAEAPATPPEAPTPAPTAPAK